MNLYFMHVSIFKLDIELHLDDISKKVKIPKDEIREYWTNYKKQNEKEKR